ncbi:hypothetical protein [Labrys miyagiensis]|uniref:hypothetical protein n=1 Tax=Labrys miyagiensis TaxID=346912 RepID=UPI0024E0F75B|nr:hypothetical protein [Labrys miyagiensis]
MRTLKDRVIESFAAGVGLPYNACYCFAFCAGLAISHYFVRHQHFGFFVYLLTMTLLVLAGVAPVFGLSVWAKIFLRRKARASNQATQDPGGVTVRFASEQKYQRPSRE